MSFLAQRVALTSARLFRGSRLSYSAKPPRMSQVEVDEDHVRQKLGSIQVSLQVSGIFSVVLFHGEVIQFRRFYQLVNYEIDGAA